MLTKLRGKESMREGQMSLTRGSRMTQGGGTVTAAVGVSDPAPVACLPAVSCNCWGHALDSKYGLFQITIKLATWFSAKRKVNKVCFIFGGSFNLHRQITEIWGFPKHGLLTLANAPECKRTLHNYLLYPYRWLQGAINIYMLKGKSKIKYALWQHLMLLTWHALLSNGSWGLAGVNCGNAGDFISKPFSCALFWGSLWHWA